MLTKEETINLTDTCNNNDIAIALINELYDLHDVHCMLRLFVQKHGENLTVAQHIKAAISILEAEILDKIHVVDSVTVQRSSRAMAC